METIKNGAGRRWRVLGGRRPSREFCQRLGVSPLLGMLLRQRGFSDLETARAFLRPAMKAIHDPELLPNIEAGTERLEKAVRDKEPILLFGDYDVDGITGAAILHTILSELGAVVRAYIPDRFTDGYGLNPVTLARIIAEESTRVVVSIDNGVVAFEAADFLKEEGIDLIVTDHHRMEEGRLPEAAAVIHPKVDGSRYPNPNLCGAGVAFKLAWSVARRISGGGKLPPRQRELMLESMALVALGTVADVMPLTGENRTLVKYGLEALERGPTPGIEALVEVSGARKPLGAGSVSFRIAPRINAAGRLGAGRRAFDLLVCRDAERSRELAAVLDKENDTRREIEKELAENAYRQVEERYGEEPTLAGLVAAGEGWHEGVVGIVASRVAERYRRPSLVLAILDDGARAKGSGRSALGVDLKAALDDCKDLLLGYGGHEAAVGLSLPAENIPALRERFAEAVARLKGVREGADLPLTEPELKIDAEMELDELDEHLIYQLGYLEPFGYGNRKPVFAATVQLGGSPRLMGKDNRHLSFYVKSGGASYRAIYWSRADLFDPLLERSALRGRPRAIRIAFRPEFNTYKGQTSIQLIIQDLKLDPN